MWKIRTAASAVSETPITKPRQMPPTTDSGVDADDRGRRR
jgi:hypothetical protein